MSFLKFLIQVVPVASFNINPLISGYLLGYNLFTTSETFSLLRPWILGYYWRLYGVMCIILPVAALLLVYYWSTNRWSNHPVAKALGKFAPQGSNWHAVASNINVEFRRFDKFTTGMEGRRVIVTDSWLIRTCTYFVYVAHQNDIHLTLERSEQHDLSHETITGVQYLSIAVNHIQPEIASFIIR